MLINIVEMSSEQRTLREAIVGYAKLLDVIVTDDYYDVACAMFKRTRQLLPDKLDNTEKCLFVETIICALDEQDVSDDDRLFVGELFKECLCAICFERFVKK